MQCTSSHTNVTRANNSRSRKENVIRRHWAPLQGWNRTCEHEENEKVWVHTEFSLMSGSSHQLETLRLLARWGLYPLSSPTHHFLILLFFFSYCSTPLPSLANSRGWVPLTVTHDCVLTLALLLPSPSFCLTDANIKTMDLVLGFILFESSTISHVLFGTEHLTVICGFRGGSGQTFSSCAIPTTVILHLGKVKECITVATFTPAVYFTLESLSAKNWF